MLLWSICFVKIYVCLLAFTKTKKCSRIYYIRSHAGIWPSLTIGTQTRGWVVGRVNPCPSSMSTTPSFSSTLHSKHWIIAARLVWTTCNPSEVPGHPLLPLPYGKRWKFCPLTSNWLFPLPSSPRNLSGLNSSGFSQCSGTRLIAHILMNNQVFSAMS